MTNAKGVKQETYPDPHHDSYSKTLFGFWIYLLTDFMLFGTLFASYAVLQNSTFGGPSPRDLFHLSFSFTQTLVLLCGAFTIGIANAFAHRKDKKSTLFFLMVTFLFGLVFMGMEWIEFTRFLEEGNHWGKSAFLSMFFTLIGTHGAHMLFGILWIIVLSVPICKKGLTSENLKRLTCLRMFWQFLNIIWIFIFSFVYLLGVS